MRRRSSWSAWWSGWRTMELHEVLEHAASRSGPVVVLTGAGISAESGIPTFRGPEGYWTVGSRHYQPEEMATVAMFRRSPDSVWAWYLHRRSVCLAAAPNAGHRALARLEAALGPRFVLLTQNVDGLHLRAGNSLDRTWQIHGNLNFMRCARECTADLLPVPAECVARERDTALPSEDASRLRCARCGGWMRPHVLWFDETYDEPRYHFESALEVSRRAALLLVVGTSGATTLPLHVGRIAASCGAALIDVDPAPNPFAAMALSSAAGCFVSAAAAAVLPDIVERCIAAFGAAS